MRLLVPGRRFAYEMENVLRLFHPGEKIAVCAAGDAAQPGTVTARVDAQPDGACALYARVNLPGFDEERTANLPARTPSGEAEWALARMLFGLLSRQTGTRPLWGTLTGVRPVRLCRSMAAAGMSEREIRGTLANRSLVSEEKIDLALGIAAVQKPLLDAVTPDSFSLYISIPFCPSRCLYCSFISHDVRGARELIAPYLKKLCEEIRYTGQLAAQLGLRPLTVYIGGGTPTTLGPEELRALMQVVRDSFDFSLLREYTVEAGRPDTITAEKLSALYEMGADRVSINPQTMNDAILRTIGRAHTTDETRHALRLAREAGFPCINMDLIAGLPGESAASFAATAGEVAALRPENITLHTLTVKRSSRLRERPEDITAAAAVDVSALLRTGEAAFSAAGYRPYYLYRQKGTVQNLENTGYALPGYEGLYNILIMEEQHTILAVGAGAVSKLCLPGHNLRRVYNYKFPHEYIAGFDEMLRRKDEAEGILRAAPKGYAYP